MKLRSFEKPISRRVSASSRTSTSVLERPSRTVGSEIRSFSRPGVATTISFLPRFHSLSCILRLVPPTSNRTWNSLCHVQTFKASFAICVASSRVGEMMTVPTVFRASCRRFWPWKLRSGIRPDSSGCFFMCSRELTRASIAGTRKACEYQHDNIQLKLFSRLFFRFPSSP